MIVRISHSFPLALIIVLLAFSPAPGEEPVVENKPRAVAVASNYEFLDIVEGKIITHDFVIRNEGTAVLDIQNIKTG